MLPNTKDNPEKPATRGTQDAEKTNQKHNTTYDGQHYMQTNKNNVNKTCALLQTTGGKDVPNIVLIRHAPSYKQLEV